MATTRKILAFGRDYLKTNPTATDRQLRAALHKRFLGDVDYIEAASEASKVPTIGVEGCLAVLVLAPLFALWYAVFPRNKQMIARDIDAVIQTLRQETQTPPSS